MKSVINEDQARVETIEFEDYENLVDASFVQVSCNPGKSARFSAGISNGYHGSIRAYVNYCSVPMLYQRTELNIASDNADDYQVTLIESGKVVVEQNGRQTVMNSGDIVIYEASSPFTLTFDGPHQTSVIKIPRNFMQQDKPFFHQMTAIKIPGATLPGNFARNMIRELAYSSYPGECKITQTLIEETFVKFMYSTLRSQVPSKTKSSMKKINLIQDFVSNDIGNLSICATSIANEFGISVRTLNRMFSESGTTFNSWLWHRRVQRCYEALKEGKNLKITEVIYDNGFSDESHFYRLFKRFYNCTPSSVKR